MDRVKIGNHIELFKQIGGNKFTTMTGSKVSYGYDDLGYVYLHIKLQKNKSKARYLEVKLNGNDLYDMKFTRIYKHEVKEVEIFNDVYADMLQDIFTSVTGFDTHL